MARKLVEEERLTSRSGVPIRLRRYRQPLGNTEIELRYGTGMPLWWPDTLRCLPDLAQILTFFLADRTAQGKPRKLRRVKNRATAGPTESSVVSLCAPRLEIMGPDLPIHQPA